MVEFQYDCTCCRSAHYLRDRPAIPMPEVWKQVGRSPRGYSKGLSEVQVLSLAPCQDRGRRSSEKIRDRMIPIMEKPSQTFEDIALGIGRTVTEKNKAYGDSFAQCSHFLKLLYPTGIPITAYENMLTIIRIWDKIKRAATDEDAFGESPFRDIAGYSILAIHKKNGQQ